LSGMLHSTVALSKNPRILPHLNSPKASLNMASTELYEEIFHISSNIDRVPSKVSLCVCVCVCVSLSQYLHLEKEMVDTAKLAAQEFQHKENRKQHENWLKLLAYSLLGSAMSAAALMLNSTRFRVQKTR
jgi:hypothetical protein